MRWERVVLAAIRIAAGGFIANRFDTAQPVTTVTRNSAPVVDRSSVAGVAAKVGWFDRRDGQRLPMSRHPAVPSVPG